MEKEKLIELARKVAEHRERVEAARQVRTSAEHAIAATLEGKAFELSEVNLTTQREALTQAEDRLKTVVLEVYKKTQERNPIDKVEVKIFKSLEYDTAEILEWCRNNATSLLVVNKKPFEKTAVDMGAPVTVKEEPKCTIAKDLSSYLEKAESDPDFELAPPIEGGK